MEDRSRGLTTAFQCADQHPRALSIRSRRFFTGRESGEHMKAENPGCGGVSSRRFWPLWSGPLHCSDVGACRDRHPCSSPSLFSTTTASPLKMRGAWSGTSAAPTAASNRHRSQALGAAGEDGQGDRRGGTIPLVCVCVRVQGRSGWRGVGMNEDHSVSHADAVTIHNSSPLPPSSEYHEHTQTQTRGYRTMERTSGHILFPTWHKANVSKSLDRK